MTLPVALRTVSSVHSCFFPRPTTTTRRAGSRPFVWTIVISPGFPVISPSAISSEICPSSAESTAPVAPPGF